MNHYTSNQQYSSWNKSWHIWLLGLLCAPFFIYEMHELIIGYIRLVFMDEGYSTDYNYYYDAAMRFRRDPLQLYDLSVRESFIYPPLSILLFLPFSYLPVKYGYLIFVIFVYMFLILSIWIFTKVYDFQSERRLTMAEKLACVSISLASALTFMNAMNGQVNTIVLYLCLVYIWLSLRKKPVLAGLVLSLAVWLKLYPTFLILLAFFKRDYLKTAPYFVLNMLLLPLIFSAFIPVQLYQYYFTEMIPSISGRTIVHIINQSLPTILTRASLAFDYYKKWEIIDINLWVKLVTVIFLICFLGFLYLRSKKGFLSDTIEANFLAIIPVLIPLGWGHTYVLVLPLILTLLLKSQNWNISLKILILFCIFAFFMPSYSYMPFENLFPMFIKKIFYSRYLLSVLVMLGINFQMSRLHMIKL